MLIELRDAKPVGFAKDYYFMRSMTLRPEGPGGNSHDQQVVDQEPIKTSERRRCGTKR